jgi:RNA polymerase sigma-70 factor (ECF subfamily)
MGMEAMLIQDEHQEKVMALLETLNPKDKAAVVMLYWYEYSYEEIADSLSMSVSAVKSRLHRARKELAENWMVSQKDSIKIERKHYEQSTA